MLSRVQLQMLSLTGIWQTGGFIKPWPPWLFEWVHPHYLGDTIPDSGAYRAAIREVKHHTEHPVVGSNIYGAVGLHLKAAHGVIRSGHLYKCI